VNDRRIIERRGLQERIIVMNNLPTFILVESLNKIDEEMKEMNYPYSHPGLQFYDEAEKELLSRQFIECDSNGNKIVNEVIGYTDDNQPIWLDPIQNS